MFGKERSPLFSSCSPPVNFPPLERQLRKPKRDGCAEQRENKQEDKNSIFLCEMPFRTFVVFVVVVIHKFSFQNSSNKRNPLQFCKHDVMTHYRDDSYIFLVAKRVQKEK